MLCKTTRTTAGCLWTSRKLVCVFYLSINKNDDANVNMCECVYV